jgi:hypothetical protein
MRIILHCSHWTSNRAPVERRSAKNMSPCGLGRDLASFFKGELAFFLFSSELLSREPGLRRLTCGDSPASPMVPA